MFSEARDNRSLTAGLAGTCIAILTFVLFFLFGRGESGGPNSLLFQWTLVNIVVGLFLISLSSMNFWFVMEALRSNHPEPGKYLRRAERFFGLGWLLLVLEPTLILVTVGLYVAGLIAFAFWIVVAVLFVQGWRDARSRPK